MVFRDRADAGRQLAARLTQLVLDAPVILALPRGGVPVGAEVARELGAPLDVILVRKLGVPGHRELAMGAIGEGGVRILNPGVARAARVTEAELVAVEARERAQLERRAEAYRSDRARLPVAGRVAVLVDDGLATGSTARAAIAVVRALDARRVVLAVPVAPPDVVAELDRECDGVIAVETPARMVAIGTWYRDFAQTPEREVKRLLEAAAG
jgi:predicted phosphoribosyltransferase